MKIVTEKNEEYQKYVEINSRDGYSLGMVKFTERWADLMEKRLSTGDELKDIAEAMSSKADTEGITVFMYGCAVSALSHFWVHGESLRRWHNLNTQLRDEGQKANEKSGAWGEEK